MRTTTNNLMSIISSKTARVDNVKLRYSSNEPDTTEEMDSSKFIESLTHLNESGMFSDSVDWKCEVIRTPEETYVMVYSYLGAAYTICKVEFELRIYDNVEINDLEKMLRETIFSQLSA